MITWTTFVVKGGRRLVLKARAVEIVPRVASDQPSLGVWVLSVPSEHGLAHPLVVML